MATWWLSVHFHQHTAIPDNYGHSRYHPNVSVSYHAPRMQMIACLGCHELLILSQVLLVLHNVTDTPSCQLDPNGAGIISIMWVRCWKTKVAHHVTSEWLYSASETWSGWTDVHAAGFTASTYQQHLNHLKKLRHQHGMRCLGCEMKLALTI